MYIILYIVVKKNLLFVYLAACLSFFQLVFPMEEAFASGNCYIIFELFGYFQSNLIEQ